MTRTINMANVLDDVMVAYGMKKRVDCYADAATKKGLTERFSYCFKTAEGSSYPPILNALEAVPGQPIRIGGAGGSVEVLPLLQQHGDITSLGYRVKGLAYSPDISDVPAETLAQLEGLDVWVVDALRYTPHPSHFHVKRALEWIARLKPKRAILTHMTTELDYATLKRELPPNVEPAYDGMTIEF
jgi:phosphoribosyl 1,2-cyclic phosphate phosphodiesterase